jgi:hypothetical protein
MKSNLDVSMAFPGIGHVAKLRTFETLNLILIWIAN